MSAVQEGRMGNSIPSGYALLWQATLGVHYDGLEFVTQLPQGARKCLLAK